MLVMPGRRAGEARDPCRKDHPQRFRRRERRSIELLGPREICGPASSPQYVRQVMLGVGRPWPRPHRLECRDRCQEVTLGIIDVADRRCEQAEVAINRADASLRMTDRMPSREWQELSVQRPCRRDIAKECTRLTRHAHPE